MKVQPLRDNVLVEVKKEDEKEKTESGIYLPDTASSSNEKPQIGKVVAVGESKDIKVSEGDEIIFSRYAGTEVKVDNGEYLIIKNEDVLAVVK